MSRFTRWIFTGLTSLAMALAASAYPSVSISIPSSVVVNVGYTGSVDAWDDMGELQTLSVSRNGSYYGSASGWGWCTYLGVSISDSSSTSGTVSYFAAADSASYSAYGSASITILANNPPIGSYDGVSASAPTYGSISASGWAADYETLPIGSVKYYIDGSYAGVATWGDNRPDVAAAFGKPNWQYTGFHLSFSASGLGIGTHSLKIVAFDQQGLSADLGTKNFDIVNTAPTAAMSIKGATSGTVTANMGETLSISVSGNDVDGNLRAVNLWVATPNTGWRNIRSDNTLNGGFVENGSSDNAISSGGSNVGSLGPQTRTFTPSLAEGAGTYQFVTRSFDAFGNSVSQQVNVTVQPPPATGDTLSISANAVLLGNSVTLTSAATASGGWLSENNIWAGKNTSDATNEFTWTVGSWSWSGSPSISGGQVYLTPTGSLTSHTRTLTWAPGSIGVWSFYSEAFTSYAYQGPRSGSAASSYNYVTVVPNLSSVSITASPSSITFGQSITFSSTATASGYISEHNVVTRRATNGTGFSSDVWDFSQWVSTGGGTAGAIGTTSSTRTQTVTPAGAGAYLAYSEAFTGSSSGQRIGGMSGWIGYYDGDSNPSAASQHRLIVPVAKATPVWTVVAPSSSWTGRHIVVAGDMTPVFTNLHNPYSTGVTAPTGTVTYSITASSGAGATAPGAITLGTTVLTPGTYTLQASYPGDTNYNATTATATFTVTSVALGGAFDQIWNARLSSATLYSQTDTVSVKGWAFSPNTNAPAGISIYIDGVLKATATPSLSRPDLVPLFGSGAANAGFSCDIALSGYAVGSSHTVSVVAADTWSTLTLPLGMTPTFTVLPPAPSVSTTWSVANLGTAYYGQTLTATSTVSSSVGFISENDLFFRFNGGAWSHATATPWNGGVSWQQVLSPINAGNSPSTRSVSLLLSTLGTFDGVAEGWTGLPGNNRPMGWTGSGANGAGVTFTVAKATPIWTVQAPYPTWTGPHTVTLADLTAIFSNLRNPYSSSVIQPTGSAVSYAITASSGTGASPTGAIVAGTTALSPGTYTLQATYSTDTYYTGATSAPITFTVMKFDDDHDGMSDAWEVDHGLSPTDPNDASADPDGDGLTNVQEYNLGTDPHSYDAGSSTVGTVPLGSWPSAGNTSITEAVGATAGSLDVDKSGAATYSIPIWVSPGIAGMQPQISLNYSSQGGAGVSGFGWSLSGASAISRGGQTLAVDGYVKGVTFTYDDRYYLDGQRLIAISGTDGGDGTEYRTEIDGFSRIVSYGTAGQGPAYFKVWTKAGLILEYGATPESAFNPGGRSEVLSWSVSKMSDTKGNSIRYEYAEDTTAGTQNLSAIRYTERSGNDYFASVLFEYEGRTDTASGYTAGSVVARTQRLKRIKSCYGAAPGDGTTMRTYELTYVERSDTGRSILTRLDETASDGQHYYPLLFNYDTPTEGWTSSALAPPVVMARDGTLPRGTGFVDLDGDGRPDFVRFHRWNADGGSYDRDAWVQRNGAWVVADGTQPGVPDWRLPNGMIDKYQPVLAWDEFPDYGTRFIDLDGDGRVDVLHAIKIGTSYYSAAYLNTPTGWSRATQWDVPAPAYLASEGDTKGSARMVDVNGDGRPDIIWRYDSGQKGCLLNTGNGWESHPEFTPTINIDGSVLFLDVNGDGLPDEIHHWYGSGNTDKAVALNTGSGWTLLTPGSADFNKYVPPYPITVQSPSSVYAPVGAEAVDLNGDGLVDIVWNNSGAGYVGAYFNTGAGWVPAPTDYIPKYMLMANNTSVGSALIDVNGDGIVDQVVSKELNPGGDAGVYLGTGRGWTNKLVRTELNLQFYVSRYDTLKAAGTDFVDLDGNGVVDQVWSLYSNSPDARRNTSMAADRLRTVTNGFGVAATITYAPLTEQDGSGNFTVYDKGTTVLPDTANIIAPIYVVKSVTHDDGVGGQYPVNYRYGGMRVHRLRGSQGFEWMRVTDSRTSIASTTTFNQAFPLTGMPITSTTVSGAVTLSESIVSYQQLNPVNAKVYMVFAKDTISTSRDLNGALISQTDTYLPTPTTDVDDYGNVKQLVVATLDGAGNPTGFAKTTVSTYENLTTAPKWQLGRLLKSTVTATAPGGKPTLTRNSGYLYDSDSGLLTDEAVEPVFTGTPAKLYTDYTDINGYGLNTLRTHYEYDAYGNKLAVRISGRKVTVANDGTVTLANAIETRSTLTEYDARGRFAAKTTNAAGHVETYDSYDQGLGLLKQLTGPNGLVTSWAYDSFGNKVLETRADTTTTATYIKWAASPGGAVPSGAKYQVETVTSGAAPSIVFHDNFSRAIRSVGLDGNGQMIYQDTGYDSMGRAYRASVPYRAGDTPYWTQTTSYDLLNRPLTTVTPDDQNGDVTTTFVYNGLTSSVTTAGGTPTAPTSRTAVSVKNSQGWTISNVRNSAAGSGAADYSEVTYDYDAYGNLTSTKAAGVATVVDPLTGIGATNQLQYDDRGRKIDMVDADMGHWLYRYNAFGELIWQKDAKGQICTMAYDLLGRLTTRVEAEGTTTWAYDTLVRTSGLTPTYWQGKLASVSAPGGYSESFTYDVKGRPSSITRTINTASSGTAVLTPYTFTTTYDSQGRVLKTEYPTVNGTNFALRNVYNNLGYLKEIRRYLASDDGKANNALQGRRYWQADSYAVDGRVQGETYGNGLANDRYYSPATGRLLTASIDRAVVTGGPYGIQDLHYTYDRVGNVLTRADVTLNRGEAFQYDGLDRLTRHSVVTGAGGIVNVTYDQKGNITSKDDVGTYSYSSTRPHAISGVSGGPLGTQTFTYDANGNMETGYGRTVHWTSFNQMLDASQGTHRSDFSFGAAHERVKQVSDRETTIYVGSSFEVVTPATSGDPTEYRHYIMAPTGRVAIYTDRSTYQWDVKYYHTDGLGSIVAVTDDKGAIATDSSGHQARFAFDAWGKRINPTSGVPITVANRLGITRGYTDHEHLDDLGLIHMNGRVYDPILGRFLSADPTVDGSHDAQGFNRYSYVGNNPMNATDPSGYFKVKEILPAVAAIVVTAAVIICTAGSGAPAAASLWGQLSYGLAHMTLTVAIEAGAAGGFASGFSGSLLNGGSIGDAFKAGAIGAAWGAASGAVAFGVGQYFDGMYPTGTPGSEMTDVLTEGGRALAHGATQGGLAEAQGGQFRHGFYAATFGSAAGSVTGHYMSGGGGWRIAERTIISAAVGGTAAVIGGGKFANGATTAAFDHMLNAEVAAMMQGATGYSSYDGAAAGKAQYDATGLGSGGHIIDQLNADMAKGYFTAMMYALDIATFGEFAIDRLVVRQLVAEGGAEVAGMGVTVHGATRIAGEAATRGGVLSAEEISLVQRGASKVGWIGTQADGAVVRIIETGPGKYSGYIEGEKGLITSFRNWSAKSVQKMATNHGWAFKP